MAANAQTRLITDLLRLGLELKEDDLFETAVICAGWEQNLPFMETTIEDWKEGMTANFERIVLATKFIVKHMIARQRGKRIIIVSSAAGLKSYRNLSVMGTSLAALHAVAQIAAVDLAAYGKRINVVAVGWGLSTFLPHEMKPDFKYPISDFIPLGGMLNVDDNYPAEDAISEFLCLMASDAISYMTGAIIPFDGGYSITKAGASTIKRE